MTLPASGPISFADINTALGRSSSAPLSLSELGNGTNISLSLFRGKDVGFITLESVHLGSTAYGYSLYYSPYGSYSPSTLNNLKFHSFYTSDPENGFLISIVLPVNGGTGYGFNSPGDGLDMIFWKVGDSTTHKYVRPASEVYPSVLRYNTAFRFAAATSYKMLLLSNVSPF